MPSDKQLQERQVRALESIASSLKKVVAPMKLTLGDADTEAIQQIIHGQAEPRVPQGAIRLDEDSPEVDEDGFRRVN